MRLEVVILRYFNPIGAHKSGLIGEIPLGIPSNLFPVICSVALKSKKFINIYGKDWNTHDGTCIRDYVHIMDIAEGHISAIKYLMHDAKSNKLEIFNLGTGKGTSVLELVRTFEKVNNCKIPTRFTDRRSGDNAISFAAVSKAKKILKWEAQCSLEEMCKDGWNFSKQRMQ